MREGNQEIEEPKKWIIWTKKGAYFGWNRTPFRGILGGLRAQNVEYLGPKSGF